MSSWIETVKSGSFLLASCLAYFDPGDGGSIFLLNFSELVATTQRYVPEEPRLYSHGCESLRPNTLYVCTRYIREVLSSYFDDRLYIERVRLKSCVACAQRKFEPIG